MAGKWSTQMTIDFLKEYGKHDCLWDCSNPRYKKRKFRLKAENAIIDAMDLPGLDEKIVREKIRILRNTYMREVKKINLSKKCDAEMLYRPTLAWFPVADTILRKILLSRPTEPNLNPTPMTPEEESDDIDIKVEGDDAITTEPHQETPKPKRKIPKMKEMKNIHGNNSLDNAVPALEEPASQTDPSLEHELDIFGKYIAAQLKQLPPRYSLKLQSSIHSSIVETRLSLMGQQGASSSSSGEVVACVPQEPHRPVAGSNNGVAQGEQPVRYNDGSTSSIMTDDPEYVS